MKVQARVQLHNWFGASMASRANVDSGVKKVVTKRNGERKTSSLQGFGIDLNSDGRINSTDDGFLAFPGKNGNYNIQQANRLLKSFAGDFDLNNDGKVTRKEKQRGRALKAQAGTLDLDGDSVLASWELQKAGAVVVKQNKDTVGANALVNLPAPLADPSVLFPPPMPQLPLMTAPPAFGWNPMFGFGWMNPFVAGWPFLY